MKAVVTGGCSGLGFSFTKELLSRGYKVYAIYNSSEKEAIEYSSKYNNLVCIKCDITDEEKVNSMIDSIDEIDLLINNAGIAIDNNYLDKTLDEFMNVIKTNLGGTFNVIKNTSRKINKNGTIINISSNNALDNFNPISMDYDASKAGINMLTKDFAKALEDFNIKVISICPGWINTKSIQEMNPHYLKEEMKRSNQLKILDPDLLAKKIIDIGLSDIESGSIIEIKEM